MRVLVDPTWRDFAKRSLWLFIGGSAGIILLAVVFHPPHVVPMGGGPRWSASPSWR